MRRATRSRWTLMVVGMALSLMALLAGCSDPPSARPAYGGSQNHMHDMLALRGVPNTVLLATHIGLYRSPDAGKTWDEVAGGAGQVMDGLMIFKLAQSPVDAQRVYVLAITRNDDPQAARDKPGLYTSADSGRTWTLAGASSQFPGGNIFTVGAGSGGAGQVFVYISGQGAEGLYRSDDAGAHWARLPALPVTSVSGVTGDPSAPGRTLLWSISGGLYTSADAGQTWTRMPNMSGVYSVSRAGSTYYANGDAGLYASTDGGAHFALVNSEQSFSAVVASDAQPEHAYAETGTAVYTSQDGGRTWRPAAATSAHPTLIAAAPDDPSRAYVAFSYPLGVQVTTDGGASWRQVLP